MSHVVSIKTEVFDLECFAKACKDLGLNYDPAGKNVRWYGKWMDDYSREDAAYKLGIKPEQYGTSDGGVVSVNGSAYDIGLIKNKETGGFKMYFDFFGHNGKTIQTAIGVNGEKLIQGYATHKVTKSMQALRSQGYVVKAPERVGEKIVIRAVSA